MKGKTWLLAVVAIVILTGPGCICCGNGSYSAAREVGADCTEPTSQRNQVYLFAVGGMNPASVAALGSLREELNRQGFAKVGTGQVVHEWWMARQMREIHSQEPEAVFVVLGSDSGCPTAARLAEKARSQGLPLAAVVFLDAEGSATVGNPAFSVRTVALGRVVTRPFGVESVDLPDAGTYTLPTDPRVVAAVTQVLTEVAQATPPPTVEHVSDWWYQDAPPARPLVELRDDHRWAFLFDAPGTVPAPIVESHPSAVEPPAYPGYTSVVR